MNQQAMTHDSGTISASKTDDFDLAVMNDLKNAVCGTS